MNCSFLLYDTPCARAHVRACMLSLNWFGRCTHNFLNIQCLVEVWEPNGSDDSFRISHLSFQEYFCAKSVVRSIAHGGLLSKHPPGKGPFDSIARRFAAAAQKPFVMGGDSGTTTSSSPARAPKTKGLSPQGVTSLLSRDRYQVSVSVGATA